MRIPRRAWAHPARVLVATFGIATAASAAGSPPPGVGTGLWNLPGPGPHIIAHYLPWFGDGNHHWSHWSWSGPGVRHDAQRILADGRRDLATKNYPLIGPYDSSERDVVRCQIRTAKAAGIEAFAALWYGPDSDTDHRMPLLLEEARAADFKICLCYEEKINFPDYRHPADRAAAVSSAAADLNYALKKYGAAPAYLRRDGRPFIFQFNSVGADELGPRFLTSSEWRRAFALVKAPVVYGRQNFAATYHPLMAASYLWFAADRAERESYGRRMSELVEKHQLTFFMSSIGPGFDDTGVMGWGTVPRVTDRGVGAMLRETLETALIGKPELVQIVTWNDWNEGTEVEPSRENGFAALDDIERWCSRFNGRPVNLMDNRKPIAIYLAKHPLECKPTPAAKPQ